MPELTANPREAQQPPYRHACAKVPLPRVLPLLSPQPYARGKAGFYGMGSVPADWASALPSAPSRTRLSQQVVSPRPGLAHPTGKPGEHCPEGDIHVE